MRNGIKQGYNLSPLLFILVRDRILTNTREETRKTTNYYGIQKPNTNEAGQFINTQSK